MTEQAKSLRKLTVATLSILLALFCFRVLAQLMQYFLALPYLPSFEAWHSGTLPYGFLLTSQLLILAVYAEILRRIATNRMRLRLWQGRFFLIVGLLYFLAMFMRLTIGLSGLSDHLWFRSYLPTLFHFVLSGYLIVVGYFHLHNAVQAP